MSGKTHLFDSRYNKITWDLTWWHGVKQNSRFKICYSGACRQFSLLIRQLTTASIAGKAREFSHPLVHCVKSCTAAQQMKWKSWREWMWSKQQRICSWFRNDDFTKSKPQTHSSPGSAQEQHLSWQFEINVMMQANHYIQPLCIIKSYINNGENIQIPIAKGWLIQSKEQRV